MDVWQEREKRCEVIQCNEQEKEDERDRNGEEDDLRETGEV